MFGGSNSIKVIQLKWIQSFGGSNSIKVKVKQCLSICAREQLQKVLVYQCVLSSLLSFFFPNKSILIFRLRMLTNRNAPHLSYININFYIYLFIYIFLLLLKPQRSSSCILPFGPVLSVSDICVLHMKSYLHFL